MSILKYKTIRSRLFIQTNGLLILFAGVLVISNTFFLEDFYRNRHIKELNSYAQEIDNLSLDKSYFDMSDYLQYIANAYNVNITIQTQNSQPQYISNIGVRKNNVFLAFNTEYGNDGRIDLGNYVEISRRGYSEKAAVVIQKNESTNLERLILYYQMDNTDITTLSTSLAAITASIGITNTFIIYITAILLIVGAIIAFIISKNFSEPIVEISNVATRIASLDFSGECSNYTIDELDKLGADINELSSKLKQTISSLNVELERERAVERMRKEFISNVSHELKTPISIIDSYAEALKVNINSNKKDTYLNVIIEETDKMNRLVKELLDLSNLNSGRFTINKEHFDILDLINKITAKYDSIFMEKSIEFDVSGLSSIVVDADPYRIEQVIINYLNNAISYVDDRRVVALSVIEEESKIRVEIFNSGIEIDDDTMSRIWESFYRADNARDRSNSNYGLGLSIVSGIMNQHGTQFGAYNTMDGPVFYFELDKNMKI